MYTFESVYFYILVFSFTLINHAKRIEYKEKMEKFEETKML